MIDKQHQGDSSLNSNAVPSYTATITLKESMENNITLQNMLANPYRPMTTAERMITKTVHSIATRVVNRIGRGKPWNPNCKPVPKSAHKLLPGHGKA